MSFTSELDAEHRDFGSLTFQQFSVAQSVVLQTALGPASLVKGGQSE